MYRNGIQSYRRASVITADGKRLVLMCYEGAIDHLRMGKQKYMQKDFEGKAKAFIKVQDIINELRCALDFEKGGEIAKNLDALYRYVLGRLTYADIHKDMKAVDEAIRILGELKSAWEQAFYKGANSLEVNPQEWMKQTVGALGA
jgi:flagellar secretion chaperone FliS